MTHRAAIVQLYRRLRSFSLLAALSLAAAPLVLADSDGEGAASTHVLRAELALKDDDYRKAVAEYREAAKLSTNTDIARQATRVAFGFGFNKDALSAAERWLELDTDSDEALVYVAQLELRLGNMRDARRRFTALIERGDDPADQRLHKLIPILSKEDPKQADKLVRLLADPYPDSALAHFAVAAIALLAGDLEHAMERSLRAAELDPEWLNAKLLYARAMMLSGDREEAIDYTSRIIGDDPDPDPDARMELALMLLSTGHDDDALSQVNQVLLEQPSRTDALRLMAIINFRQNNLDAARDDFETLLASRRFTMDALFYLARIADIRKEFDKAIGLYSEVSNGRDAVIAQRRVSVLLAFENSDPEAALAWLDQFGDENPEFAIDMVLSRAQLLTSLGRHEEALAYYDKAVDYRPDDENTALSRAELMLHIDRVDDSISAYRDAARRWPESPITLNAFGYTLADRTKKYREAEKLIRRALKFDPDSPAIIDSLGWVLFKRGRFSEALVQLETAYDRLPDHEVAAHLVEVLTVLERTKEALDILVAAELRTPESQLLAEVRERLFP